VKITKAEVNKVLAVEFIFYPQTTITPELVKAWHLHFKDCTREDFFAAMHVAVAENKTGFPPSPGAVREYLKKLKANPEDLETADQAWAILLKNGKPSARAIAATEIMPDWHNRGRWETQYLPFRKKEFERIYNDLKEKDEILETQGIVRSQIGYGRESLPEIAKSLLGEFTW